MTDVAVLKHLHLLGQQLHWPARGTPHFRKSQNGDMDSRCVLSVGLTKIRLSSYAGRRKSDVWSAGEGLLMTLCHALQTRLMERSRRHGGRF